MTAGVPTFPPAATGLPGRPTDRLWPRALAVGVSLALGGCGGGGGFCQGVVAPPPDAGPMLVFGDNPIRIADGSETWGIAISSLSGQSGTIGETTYVQSSLGFSCETGVLADARLLVDCVGPSTSGPAGLLSLSSGQSGSAVTVQSIVDSSGAQICTSLGEPCGTHGDCCTGLSCQAVDAGCSCAYAWPPE